MSYIIERADQALADYNAWSSLPLAERTAADPHQLKINEFAGRFGAILQTMTELYRQPAKGRHSRTGTGWV
jgi:hypothetical protein